MKRFVVVIFAIGILAACTPANPQTRIQVDRGTGVPVVTGIEGQQISLKPQAVDPDGDTITYHYSEPFNPNGTWNTSEGDAGTYNVTITASDGQATITQTVTVRVHGDNKPPLLRCQNIQVYENEQFRIPCNATDPDGDDVVLMYEGLNDTSWYAAGYDDAGIYHVNVTAMDKHYTVHDTVTVAIKNKNRPPRIKVEPVKGEEQHTIKLNPSVSDPDGDSVKVTYEEPFTNGKWTPKRGDAGTYNITVNASDGTSITTRTVTVTVEEYNTAPNLYVQDVHVEEGETVTLPITANDPDGDNLTVAIRGWMKQRSTLVTYNDAYPGGCSQKGCTATYRVNVTVSDGQRSTQRTMTVFVEDVNRPPVFKRPA